MAHMVEQVIKFSDGTETVINYRGKIVNGVLIPNEEIKMSEETQAVPEAQAPAEAPAPETVSAE